MALRAFRFTFSWRYIIAVSFIRIAFVVAKFKISVPIQHPMPFWEVLGTLLPQMQFNIAEILTKGSTLAKKKFAWKFFWRILNFMEKDGPKLSIFGPTLPPPPPSCLPLKIAEVKKNMHQCRKTSAIGPSKYVKIKALSPLLFPSKIQSLFGVFGLFLSVSRAGSQVRGLESKVCKVYIIHTVPVNFL